MDKDKLLHLARDIKPGTTLRVDHECGPGRTLLVGHDAKEVRGWCFRCSAGYRATLPLGSLVQRVNQLTRAQENTLCKQINLPAPLVLSPSEWPDAAALWLYRAGFNNSDIMQLGAGWHEPTQRVVIPVRGPDGAVIFWQARAVDGCVPKYLSPMVNKAGLVPSFGASPIITLTEDLLSAAKVGKAGGRGIALLGTSLGAGILLAAVKSDRPVNVWLDPDGAGQRAAKKIAKVLRANGVSCVIVQSERDPKTYEPQEIRTILGVTI